MGEPNASSVVMEIAAISAAVVCESSFLSVEGYQAAFTVFKSEVTTPTYHS